VREISKKKLYSVKKKKNKKGWENKNFSFQKKRRGRPRLQIPKMF